jgi:hypothetical protein
LSKTAASTTIPAASRADKEQDKIYWTLMRADLEAVVLRINSIVKVGSETNLPTVRRVIRDVQSNIDTIIRHYGAQSTETAEEAQQ